MDRQSGCASFASDFFADGRDDSQKSGAGARRIVLLERGGRLSEATLWLPWVHRGKADIAMDSEVAALCARRFCEVSLKFPDVRDLAQQRAEEFLLLVQKAASSQPLNDTLGMDISIFQIQADADEDVYMESLVKSRPAGAEVAAHVSSM